MTDQPKSLTPEESMLWRTSVSLLPRFMLDDAGILSRQVVWDGQHLLPSPLPSPRYTAEAVKALYLLRRHALPCPLEPDALLEHLVTGYLDGLEFPDVALTLWADALGEGRYHAKLWDALTKRVPRRADDMMHLAWTLSAVCHCLPRATARSAVADVAHSLAKKIASAQVRSGLFRSFRPRLLSPRPGPRVGTLAVQIFPIQALAIYGRVFRIPEAVERAERCATVLCRLQGAQGQWWRSYDVRGGRVADAYPVYSVNQDGAVPLALDELHAAAGHLRYRSSISRGLAWVMGNNETGDSLVDEAKGIVWDGVESVPGGFRVLRHVYSYHPARCLYWLAARGV